MTKISALLEAGWCFSIELWPPKNLESENKLRTALSELEALEPDFVSITYGAAGSTRERTHELVVDLLNNSPMTPMAHLSCMEHSKKELSIILERYKKAGVENILALRGDPPLNATVQLSQGELVYASELVELAKQVGNFCVAVAAHPEGHPLSLDLTQDRYRLSQKLDKADFAITQFFFNPQYYFDLVDSLRVLGVDKPVIPGIMPIVNLRTVFKMSELSGTSVPKEILARLQAVGANPDDLRRVGVEIAVDLCEQLLQAGVPGLHFYTMNSFVSTKEIYEALGLGARRSKS